MGDFFGVSNGQVRPINSLAFTANSGYDRAGRGSWGFNCYLPMPFARGGRIEIENQGGIDAGIWFHIDYELYDNIDGAESIGRLHAQWNRENPTRAVALPKGKKEIKNLTGRENYAILDIKGDGQFAGYFLTVVNHERAWWGEGDDMIFIDGEGFPPSINGTGTEEIFGGGASPVTEYSHSAEYWNVLAGASLVHPAQPLWRRSVEALCHAMEGISAAEKGRGLSTSARPSEQSRGTSTFPT